MHFNKSYMTSLSLRFLISNDGNIIVICSNIVLMDIDAALAYNCDTQSNPDSSNGLNNVKKVKTQLEDINFI